MKVMNLIMPLELEERIEDEENWYDDPFTYNLFEDDLANYLVTEENKSWLVHSIIPSFDGIEHVSFKVYFTENPTLGLNEQIEAISNYIYGQALDGWGEEGFEYGDRFYQFENIKPQLISIDEATPEEIKELYFKELSKSKAIDGLNNAIRESTIILDKLIDQFKKLDKNSKK